MMQFDGTSLTLENLSTIAQERVEIKLAAEELARMARSCQVVETLRRTGPTIYGINTGFGKLSDVRVSSDDLETLPKNFFIKNSGFMVAQIAAASFVSKNKVLSHPAPVDSIPTSANKEDDISMGAAAIKARNATQVLAIELLAACQALDLHAPLKPGPATGGLQF